MTDWRHRVKIGKNIVVRIAVFMPNSQGNGVRVVHAWNWWKARVLHGAGPLLAQIRRRVLSDDDDMTDDEGRQNKAD